jgi:hypothetical protein
MRADESLQRMQSHIRKEIRNAVTQFESETGLTPQRIVVEMTEVTSASDHKRRFLVSDVRVSLGEQ